MLDHILRPSVVLSSFEFTCLKFQPSFCAYHPIKVALRSPSDSLGRWLSQEVSFSLNLLCLLGPQLCNSRQFDGQRLIGQQVQIKYEFCHLMTVTRNLIIAQDSNELPHLDDCERERARTRRFFFVLLLLFLHLISHFYCQISVFGSKY